MRNAMALENNFLNRDEFWMPGVGVQWNLFEGGPARKKASALSFRSNAVFNGLAMTLIFGILVSTALTLLVIPVLYDAFAYKSLQ